MSPIKKTLYDHWLILFTALLVVFLGSLELTSLKLFSHYILPFFSTWYITTIIVLFLTLIFTLTKLLKNRDSRIGFFFPPPDPPRYKYKETEKLIDGPGVKWKVWLGHDRFGGGEEDQRVWVEGPYCPKCLYEVDRDKTKKKWHCLKCNKYIPIPQELREDTIEKMIKIFTADFERQKHNNLSSRPQNLNHQPKHQNPNTTPHLTNTESSNQNPNAKTQPSPQTPNPKDLTTKHSLSQNPSNLRHSSLVQFSVLHSSKIRCPACPILGA